MFYSQHAFACQLSHGIYMFTPLKPITCNLNFYTKSKALPGSAYQFSFFCMWETNVLSPVYKAVAVVSYHSAFNTLNQKSIDTIYDQILLSCCNGLLCFVHLNYRSNYLLHFHWLHLCIQYNVLLFCVRIYEISGGCQYTMWTSFLLKMLC
jgi:hypothetical protein